MSLAGIWSGNFHQLRNSLGSNRSLKLLRFHARLTSSEVVDARRCILRPLATNAEGRNQKSQSIKPCSSNLNLSGETVGSTNLNTNERKNCEFKAVLSYDLQQKICDKRIAECPATFLVIDIETTGFSRKSERIIEIALRDLVGGKDSTFQTLVKPDKYICNTNVHGISSHMVNRPEVPRFDELIPILMQFVHSRQIEGKPVVFIAHNGRRFDIPFIISEFQRCSMKIPADWRFLDTLPLARQLLKPDGSKLESLTLEALREYYRLPLVGPAHRAMQDVNILCYVFQRMTFDLKLTQKEIIDRAFQASDITKSSQ